MELADALNEVLSGKWRNLRGLEIVSFGVSSVKASEEDEQMLKEMQRNAAFMDPTRAAAHLVGAQAAAMQSAASNQGAGPAMAFMGMNMAGQMGGMNAQNLYQMGAQQQAQQAAAQPAPAARRLDVQVRQDRQHGQILRRMRQPEAGRRQLDVQLRCGEPRQVLRRVRQAAPHGPGEVRRLRLGSPGGPAPKFCPECGRSSLSPERTAQRVKGENTMPTQVTNYQCPGVYRPAAFVGASGKLECDYCGSTYDVAEIEALYAEKEAKAAETQQKEEQKQTAKNRRPRRAAGTRRT